MGIIGGKNLGGRSKFLGSDRSGMSQASKPMQRMLQQGAKVCFMGVFLCWGDAERQQSTTLAVG
jgi:hypothetical protein